MFVHQMDIKTAYLNAPIDCEIFMELPEGYEGKSGEKLVYKLRKSLYGFKQSGRNWNNMLHEYLLGENFTQWYQAWKRLPTLNPLSLQIQLFIRAIVGSLIYIYVRH